VLRQKKENYAGQLSKKRFYKKQKGVIKAAFMPHPLKGARRNILDFNQLGFYS